MSYQASWQEKTRKLPQEIFSRIEKTDNHSTFPPNRSREEMALPGSLKRALVIGKGIELLLPDLNRFLDKSEWKIFISQAENAAPEGKVETHHCHCSSASPDNLVYLKGESNEHLVSFPAEIFDLIISLWELPSKSSNTISYMSSLYRLLKKGGRLSIISYLDGSPQIPLDIIKKVIHKNKLPLKIFKSALPDSTKNLRKILNKTGFGDVRIWQDCIACSYQSAEDLYSDIFSDGEGNLFMDNTTDEQRSIIRAGFIKSVREYSFPLEISYDFAGGLGVKP